MTPEPLVYYVVTKNGLPSVWPRRASHREEEFMRHMGYTIVRCCISQEDAERLQKDIIGKTSRRDDWARGVP